VPIRPPPVKLYYRIGEVAETVGVQPHVLRYWESEFGQIRPQKSARGQRVYSHKDLERLLRVKQLLHGEGYTIAGARKKLREGRSDEEGETLQSNESLEKIRGDLGAIRADLVAELERIARDT
jgi:DNA-binding transcriptional MerR regulator